jgi:hypothetical protein
MRPLAGAVERIEISRRIRRGCETGVRLRPAALSGSVGQPRSPVHAAAGEALPRRVPVQVAVAVS